MPKKREGQRRPRRLVTNTVQQGEDHKPGAPMGVGSENRAADVAQSQAGSSEVAEPEAASEPEPIPPDEGAKSFGEEQRCWAVVEISEDRLQATLTAMALNGFVPTAQELARDLGHAFGLQGHFDGKALRPLLAPAQVAAVVKKHPEIGKAGLVVEQKDGKDTMTRRCEVAGGDPELAATIADTLQSLCNLKGDVELTEPGSLANDGKVIDDRRDPA